MVKNAEILKIFKRIKKFGLFTNSKTHDRVYDALANNPEGEDGAKFIATTGVPVDEYECSECRKTLPATQFSYYHTRVKQDGSLMRSNALCHECTKKLNQERQRDLGAAQDEIPPQPQPGDKCPNCDRVWTGNWHRDHDYETGQFRSWLCGQCNMAKQDRRNPNPKL